MGRPDREAVARALYELDPYVAPQEYLGVMGTNGQGVLQLVGGGPYSWVQAVEADAIFGQLSFYEPLTARAYRMADAALNITNLGGDAVTMTETRERGPAGEGFTFEQPQRNRMHDVLRRLGEAAIKSQKITDHEAANAAQRLCLGEIEALVSQALAPASQAAPAQLADRDEIALHIRSAYRAGLDGDFAVLAADTILSHFAFREASQAAPVAGADWLPMKDAPTGVPIIAKHKPNARMPRGWVGTIKLGHRDEEEAGALDTILHYNGDALIGNFHGCWEGWMPIGSAVPVPHPPGDAERLEDEEPPQTHIPLDEMSPEGKTALAAVVRAARGLQTASAERLDLGFPPPSSSSRQCGWAIDVGYLTKLIDLAQTKCRGEYDLEQAEALLLSIDFGSLVPASRPDGTVAVQQQVQPAGR